MYGYNEVDDYLLAWFHESTGECGKKSNDLVYKKKYMLDLNSKTFYVLEF